MRILAIHVSHIDWRATRKAKFAEELERREDGMDDCVVLFSCVEKQDEADPVRVADGAAREAVRRLGMLKVKKAVVFPFAHLASDLGRPEVALQALKGLENCLRARGLEVKRAPFGWYKEYSLNSMGHPMSELSMTICPYEGKSCEPLCPYCSHPVNVGGLSRGTRGQKIFDTGTKN